MHGGTSKNGGEHPNYRHGRYSKPAQELFRLLNPRRPIGVQVLLFPFPMKEAWKHAGLGPLQPLVIPPEKLTIGEWMRALRAARRELGEELAEIRQWLREHAEEAADGSEPPAPVD
jgi:hypothetical protein